MCARTVSSPTSRISGRGREAVGEVVRVEDHHLAQARLRVQARLQVQDHLQAQARLRDQGLRLGHRQEVQVREEKADLGM